jgi:Mrp family chromosome partitioning ATPase
MSKVFEALENARISVVIGSARAADAPIVPPHAATLSAVPADFSRVDLEEEMVRLHQSVRALLPGGASRVIQFVSARSGEGASTVAREFARVATTRFDERTLLVEVVDGRQVTGLSSKPMALDVNAMSVVEMRWAAATNTHAERSELHRFRQDFQWIVIDGPPADLAARATPHGSIDGTVLVIQADRTRWPVADHLTRSLKSAGLPLIGAVLTKRRFYVPGWLYRRL